MELHPWWHPACVLESCLLDLTVSYMVGVPTKTRIFVLSVIKDWFALLLSLFCILQVAVAVHAVLREVGSILHDWENQRGSC